MILVCQMRHRQRRVAAGEGAASFPMPGTPASTVVALGPVAMVLVLLAFDDDTVIALYVTPAWAAIVVVGYLLSRSRHARAAPPPVAAEGGR